VVRPELTEGPYYVNEDLNRSDIRSDPATGAMSAGVPLAVTFRVSQVAGSGCVPLAGAKVEVWHADATGRYSDVADPGGSTQGQQFLRGFQETDANGVAQFTTIYPGGYQGRAVHIHFKVRPDANSEFTSQLFFDDALSDQVFAVAPYAATGQQRTRNGQDGIYTDQMLLNVAPAADGYATTFDMAMQPA
jgi:protocatechuate 3,4-dioxygenase beta subunit